MQVISRSAAKAAGLKYFFTGERCRGGHVDARFVSSYECRTCSYAKVLRIYHSKRPPLDGRTCAVCGHALSSNKNRKARYCSNECRRKSRGRKYKRSEAAWRRANRARINKRARDRYANDPLFRARIKDRERASKAARQVVDRSCLECGKPFDYQPKAGNRRRFCSSECRAARKRTTYESWYQAHRDEQLPKHAANRRRYKAEKPDYFKNHYAANRDRKKRDARAWYRANADYALGRQKEYAAKRLAENPDHVRAIGRKHAQARRAIKKSVFVEHVDPRVVFERDKGICGICLGSVDPKSKWEVDHKIPLSKGGPHSYENTQLSHRKCNRKKWASLPSSVS